MATTLLAVAAKSAAGPNSRVTRAVQALPKTPTNISDLERAGSAALGGGMIAIGLDGDGPGPISLIAGGYLLYRAATGNCPVYQLLGVNTAPKLPKRKSLASNPGAGGEVVHAVIVNKSAQECYRYWHHFENLPRFLMHLVKVTRGEGRVSHWVAQGPLGMRLEWDAETTLDITNREIAWKSTPNADVDTVGSVQFKELPFGRGTEVRLAVKYAPPGGQAGMLLSKLFGQSPQSQIRADLRQYKEILEAGEVPTVVGQAHGRRGLTARLLTPGA